MNILVFLAEILSSSILFVIRGKMDNLISNPSAENIFSWPAGATSA